MSTKYFDQLTAEEQAKATSDATLAMSNLPAACRSKSYFTQWHEKKEGFAKVLFKTRKPQPQPQARQLQKFHFHGDQGMVLQHNNDKVAVNIGTLVVSSTKKRSSSEPDTVRDTESISGPALKKVKVLSFCKLEGRLTGASTLAEAQKISTKVLDESYYSKSALLRANLHMCSMKKKEKEADTLRYRAQRDEARQAWNGWHAHAQQVQKERDNALALSLKHKNQSDALKAEIDKLKAELVKTRKERDDEANRADFFEAEYDHLSKAKKKTEMQLQQQQQMASLQIINKCSGTVNINYFSSPPPGMFGN